MWRLSEHDGGVSDGPGGSADEAGTRSRVRGESGDPAEWVRERLGFDGDAMQRRVLRMAGPRVILNCTRQWGKSTVTGGQGGPRGVDEAGKPDAGGQPERTA